MALIRAVAFDFGHTLVNEEKEAANLLESSTIHLNRGLVVKVEINGTCIVTVTPLGLAFLEQHGRRRVRTGDV